MQALLLGHSPSREKWRIIPSPRRKGFMKRKEHCEESIRLFGKPFNEVHAFLDEFANLPNGDGTYRFNVYHRKYRHHLVGAKLVEEMFGRQAYEAAIRHIISDLKAGGGFMEGDEIPIDEADYIKKGFI